MAGRTQVLRRCHACPRPRMKAESMAAGAAGAGELAHFHQYDSQSISCCSRAQDESARTVTLRSTVLTMDFFATGNSARSVRPTPYLNSSADDARTACRAGVTTGLHARSDIFTTCALSLRLFPCNTSYQRYWSLHHPDRSVLVQQEFAYVWVTSTAVWGQSDIVNFVCVLLVMIACCDASAGAVLHPHHGDHST